MNILSGLGGGGAVKSIIIRFIADTQQASRNIQNFIDKQKSWEKGARKGGRIDLSQPFSAQTFMGGGYGGFLGGRGALGHMMRHNKLVEILSKKYERLGLSAEQALSKIGSRLTLLGAAIGGLVYSMKKTFELGTLVESSLISMKLFAGGNMEKARYIMRRARDFSLRTPFKPAETFVATKSLMQFGIEPFKGSKYNLPKGMSPMDIVAGLGSYTDIHGSKLGMSRAAYALQRGEMRLLRPYGAPVIQAHERALQSGIAGTPAYTAKFIEELGKIPQVMKMAEEQSRTIAGLWSTISGFAEEIWIAMSGADAREGVVTLFSHVRSIMKDIRDIGLDFMRGNEGMFMDLGAMIGSFLEFLWKGIKLFGDIMGPTVKVFLKVLQTVFVVVEGIFRVFSQMLIIISQIVEKFNEISGFFDFVDWIIIKIEDFTQWLSAMFTILIAGIQQSLSGVIGFMDKHKEVGKEIVEWVNPFTTGRKMTEFVSGLDEEDNTKQKTKTMTSAQSNKVNQNIVIHNHMIGEKKLTQGTNLEDSTGGSTVLDYSDMNFAGEN